ncbi:MAG: hypothetical protein PUI23_05685 [Bacteroidales bacterium]|nr:hypothetical protein [Bacteroidales bacterium]MDD7501351.1 hypothetical protein [Bacteroidales bacterium]MDY3007842.1 hypothetical protein [Sodaliphilus sp.]MDY5225523.1 hypothetical protein [Sodaliphilus sp.]MDY5705335.1 hypothetical protein [Sodaliphilus sp.]
MNLEELLSECTFERVTPTLLEQCEPFACGHDDLDEFFRSDYKLYADKLLGKTYAFRLIDNPSKIVSIFTLSNDAIRIKQLVAEDKEQIEYVTENGEKSSADSLACSLAALEQTRLSPEKDMALR